MYYTRSYLERTKRQQREIADLDDLFGDQFLKHAMFDNGAKVIPFASYLNARVVDLVDGALGRQPDVLLDVRPVHEGQVDGTGDV